MERTHDEWTTWKWLHRLDDETWRRFGLDVGPVGVREGRKGVLKSVRCFVVLTVAASRSVRTGYAVSRLDIFIFTLVHTVVHGVYRCNRKAGRGPFNERKLTEQTRNEPRNDGELNRFAYQNEMVKVVGCWWFRICTRVTMSWEVALWPSLILSAGVEWHE